jgi:hypothetical protein
MFKGLIEAAIWTNEEQLCEEAEREYEHQPAYRGDWVPEKAGISVDDFAPSAIAYLEDLCRQFESTFPEFCSDPDEYLIVELRNYTALNWVGHVLWMDTNRHGVGFWDGNWEEITGNRLSAWCHDHGGIDIYFGDDNLIYVSGKEDYSND